MDKNPTKTKVLFVITKSTWGGASALGYLLRNPRFLTLTTLTVFLHGGTTVPPTPFLAPPHFSTI
jgi:hypothetical protein